MRAGFLKLALLGALAAGLTGPAQADIQVRIRPQPTLPGAEPLNTLPPQVPQRYYPAPQQYYPPPQQYYPPPQQYYPPPEPYYAPQPRRAAPVTPRVNRRQVVNYCETAVDVCQTPGPMYAGQSCTCFVPGYGRIPGHASQAGY